MLRRFVIGLAAASFAWPAAVRAAEWTVDHAPPEDVVVGEPVQMQFGVSPAEDVSYVIVYIRDPEERKYKPLVVRPSAPGEFRAEVPPERVTEPEMRYFLRVVDDEGESTDVLGSVRNPRVVQVAAQPVEDAAPAAAAAQQAGADETGGDDEIPESFYDVDLNAEASGAALEADLDELDALEAEFQLLQVEDVVISAAKRTQSVVESPSAIHVITRDDIEGFGFRTLSEALRFAPGMQVMRVNESTTLVGARGFADESNNLVLFLEQGRELNSELFGSPFLENQALSLHDVERIEVVRGPGSALYGANAFSGVVQVIPRRPSSFENDFRLIADQELVLGGQHAEARASGVTGEVEYHVNGKFRQLEGAADGSARGLRQASAKGRLLLDAGELPLEFDFGFSNLEGELFSILGETTADLNEAHIAGRTQVGPAQFLLYWNHWDARFGIADPTLFDSLPKFNWSNDTVNLDIQSDWTFGDDLDRLTIGANVRFNRFESDQLANSVSTETRVGVFVQNELQPLDRLILNFGIRGDFATLFREDDSFIDRLTFSPRGAIIVPINDNHGVRVGAGLAFRKPSFFEQNARFSSLLPLGIEIANEDLQNEEIFGVDAGYTGRFGDVRVNLDLFYNEFRDFIVFDDATTQFLNEGRDSDSFGGEVSLRYRVNDQMALFSNYSYLKVLVRRPDPTPEEPDRIDFVDGEADPEHMVNAGFRYKADYGLRLGIAVHWQSEIVREIVNPNNGSLIFAINETQRIDDFFNVTARLGWNFGHWEIGFQGQQLQSDRTTEFPGLDSVSIPDTISPPAKGDRFGGERLPPRVFAYLEGRF